MGSFFVSEENGIPVFHPNTTTYDDYMITESQARLLRTLYVVGNQPPVSEQIRIPRRCLDTAPERKARARASSSSIGTKAEAVAQISHGVSVLNLGQSSADNTNPAAAAGSLPTSSAVNNK